MKFWPLCVDYHFRAQEIIATEREIRVRRAILRSLPNPSPPCNHSRCRHWNADRDDDDGIRSSLCDVSINTHEKKSTPNNASDEFDEPNVPIRQVDERSGEPAELQSTEMGVISRDGLMQQARICEIMNTLGPAIHPSECAFRPVAKATKGQIRGGRIPLVWPLPCRLQAVANLYSNRMENILDAVIGALESGRWRVDSSIIADDALALASSVDITMKRPRDTTFWSTMKIEYIRFSSILDIRTFDPCHEMESMLNSQIWTQHVTNLPMPTSTRHLRHDPDDLAAIYRLKSQRSSETTSFAINVAKSFGPQLRTSMNLSRDKLMKKVATGWSTSAISIKPTFILEPYDITLVSKENYLSRIGTIPFTQFFDHDDIETSEQQYGKMAENKSPRSKIRLDPDFDPMYPTSISHKPKTRDLLIPLDRMCNSVSVLSILHNSPSRFGESHRFPNGLTRFVSHQTHHRFEFITNILKNLKESVENDQCLPLLLSIHDSRASINGTNFLPRKIRLDAEIKTPLFVHVQDVQLKSNSSKRPLGSIVEMNFFSRTMSLSQSQHAVNADGGQSNIGSLQNRFVDSSSRVMGVSILESLIRSSHATSIFLPQSIVHTSPSKECVSRFMNITPHQQSVSSDVLSAIRSRKKTLLTHHCSNYPTSFCFGNGSESNLHLKNPAELDLSILNVKRKTFCRNAKLRSKVDGSLTLLLTGCSSRKSAESIYSYCGFLTNHIIDPNVFKHRYSSTLQTNKLFTSTRVNVLGYEVFFTRIIFGVLAESFVRHLSKTTSQDWELTHNAPYYFRLETKRHGQRHRSSCTTAGAEMTLQNIGSKFQIKLSKIEEFASRFSGNDVWKGSDIGILAVEALGKSSLKLRGELLHLVMKASEWEDGMKSFLAEFAGANRLRDSSQHVLLDGVGNDSTFDRVTVPSCPHLAVTVDPTAPDENQSTKKRSPELQIDEDIERKVKKMRKKEKKKRKKSSKRKRRGDNSCERSKLREAAEAMPQAGHNISYTAIPSNRIIHVACPLIPLGFTPIHPPKKLEQRRHSLDRSDGLTKNDVDDVRGIENSDRGTYQASISAAVGTSPDSVANLNSVRTTNLSEPNIGGNGIAQIAHNTAHPENGVFIHRQIKEASVSYNQSEVCEDKSSPWHLLTSESFLESYGEVVAELASGTWRKSLLYSEITTAHDLLKGIIVCDSPLVDVAGADIELSDNSAVIVQYLSTWSEKIGYTDSGSIPHGSRAFIRRLVLLAASGRYSAIHVALCLDVDMSSALTEDIINLQNAVNRQSGCPTEHVTFEFVSPRSLAASIALKLMSVSNPQESSQLAEFILDEKVRERARFLIMLVPTMTVHMAVRCMGFSSNGIESGEAMHNIFVLATKTPRDLFPQKMKGILPMNVSAQLWLALNVDISHAY